ncbi:hypothetical protein SBD_0952 [Streptomyces bottropensis ATCC 25435]|uniref:Uncharacterized protein n=1 Tax=Streptomyces bottropensis ATCC 25435 TaxID=1054862 RepID=M3FYV8_9ACTN|nr:hypothetical protein SBD_0952 [Streptomyces bottropensis ATCC 25435]
MATREVVGHAMADHPTTDARSATATSAPGEPFLPLLSSSS